MCVLSSELFKLCVCHHEELYIGVKILTNGRRKKLSIEKKRATKKFIELNSLGIREASEKIIEADKNSAIFLTVNCVLDYFCFFLFIFGIDDEKFRENKEKEFHEYCVDVSE